MKNNPKKLKVAALNFPDGGSCTCGNIAGGQGFFPCNEKGEEVEPTDEAWTARCYICDACGNIIKQETSEIIGVASKETREKNWDRMGT